jgi:oxygen-independent coproporphyrinogen-3 oxidase
MLLYIHVPFCRSRCGYCSFYSQALPGGEADRELIRAYMNGLLAEVALWGGRLGRVRLESIFFGGGTPSLLPARLLGQVLDQVRKRFSLSAGAEVSFEGNPESMLQFGYAAELVKIGVNRLSLGVQSLDEERLRLLGRPHSLKEALAAYDAARVCGIANINLDLLWGLPGQRLRLWLEELKSAVRLKPEHLSCYNLTLEEDAPMSALLAQGEISLPDDKEQSAMYAYGSEYLETQGFMRYEISNYARMGFKCRHNLGYWEGHDYLGLGPSAASTIQGRRWSNPVDLREWRGQIASRALGGAYESLDKTTRVLELIMLRLRTDRGLRLSAYRQLTGRDFAADNKELIRALHSKGMLRIKNGYLSLTGAGMLVSNSILEYLFTSTREKLDAPASGQAGLSPRAPFGGNNSPQTPSKFFSSHTAEKT